MAFNTNLASRSDSCVVDGCAGPWRVRRMCNKHYRRSRKGQDLLAKSQRDKTPAERFFEKVDASSDCWIWTGALLRNGYGYFGSDGRTHLTHRWSWEHLVGPIPDGLVIDHLCRVHACVNPDHLDPVTQAVNRIRGVTARTHNSSKTHCPANHPYDEANTYVSRSGKRSCRECTRVNDRRRKREIYRLRKPAAGQVT